jgi:RNA polymerase sigma factor FliA
MIAAQVQLSIEGLWEKYKKYNDPEARETIILQYSSLVKYVAGRLAISMPANVQKDDLVSYGIFGLIDAIEKFDHERGFKFETYAIARIRGAILDGLRSMDWVPYSVRHKSKELEKAFTALEIELGRSATDEEVCGYLGVTLEQFNQMLTETRSAALQSLDEFWHDGQNPDSLRLIDTIEDPNCDDPTSNLEFEETKGILGEAIEKLPERERMVVALYYYDGLTLKEIGEVLGVSESRISQMHSKAILRLRGRLSRIKKRIF